MNSKIHPHIWKYNFPSIPNKRICTECYKREKMNLRTFEWDETFKDSRTDKELVLKWFFKTHFTTCKVN